MFRSTFCLSQKPCFQSMIFSRFPLLFFFVFLFFVVRAFSVMIQCWRRLPCLNLMPDKDITQLIMSCSHASSQNKVPIRWQHIRQIVLPFMKTHAHSQLAARLSWESQTREATDTSWKGYHLKEKVMSGIQSSRSIQASKHPKDQSNQETMLGIQSSKSIQVCRRGDCILRDDTLACHDQVSYNGGGCFLHLHTCCPFFNAWRAGARIDVQRALIMTLMCNEL